MPKRKKLNGLPNALVQRYFSTLFYWDGGYMADWIWKIANEQAVSDFEIDIIRENITPASVQIKPLLGHLSRLKETIAVTLSKNNFPENFISAAKFLINIPEKFKAIQMVECKAVITDIEGRNYEGKTYSERAYEINQIRRKAGFAKWVWNIFR